jgi:hypothetical protein
MDGKRPLVEKIIEMAKREFGKEVCRSTAAAAPGS